MSLSFIEQVAMNMNIILHIIAKMQFGAFKLQLVIHVNFPCKYCKWTKCHCSISFVNWLMKSIIVFCNSHTIIVPLALDGWTIFFVIHPLMDKMCLQCSQLIYNSWLINNKMIKQSICNYMLDFKVHMNWILVMMHINLWLN